MARYLPIVLGMVLIVGLTIPQVLMTDRLSGANVSAEQRAELLKLVPKSFGDWQSEDKPVDPKVQKTAGALGVAIWRDYRNARTGERVVLWLIVGHARDIAFHTPDVCYPASGLKARSPENSLYPISVPGLPDAPFLTNTFYKEDQQSGRTLIRVFWAWFNPEAKENNGQVVWEAPTNARWRFGNTRALYKMYFTSDVGDQMETAERSSCVHFARDFLPVVDKILSEVHRKSQTGEAAEPGGEQTPVVPAVEPASDSAKPEAGAGAGEKDAAPATGSTSDQPATAPAKSE